MARTLPVLSPPAEIEPELSLADKYITAGEVVPIRIPLEKADLGPIRYQAVSDGDLYDLELLYEMQTAELLVRSAIPSLGDTAGPGTFRLSGIRAAKLDLINEIPGSLEGMMTRLVLEIDEDVVFDHILISMARIKNEEDETEFDQELRSRKVILTASIHETGHLRDVLLFLKSDNTSSFTNISTSNPYINPMQNGKFHRSLSLNKDTDPSTNPPLTFLDTLPLWSVYIPWWVYTRKIRKAIQLVILLYSIFSIIWASWQLYRHVHFIHIAFQPVVNLLRMYLKDVMETLDEFLASLTHYWTSLLSPLNVFSSLLVLPIWNTLVQLKSILVLVVMPLSRCFTPFSRCLSPAYNCLMIVWRAILNSKMAVQSLDISRIQQSYIANLLLSCLRATFFGLAKLVGYSKSKSKQRQAIKQQRKFRGSVSATSPRYGSAVPVYYNSPLLRQDDSD